MNPDKLFDYLDGKLAPSERAQLEERLMSDAQLRREFNIAREIHRAAGDSREVLAPSDEPGSAAKSAKLARRIAVGAVVLVFLNVTIGLLVIAGKNRKSGLNEKEADIRQQLELSLGAAAQNAMPAPSFVEEEIRITASRAEWENVANKIVDGATAFGGSAAKGLPDENVMTVIADVPSQRAAEFRQALNSAAAISPMPAIAQGENAGADDSNERTIVQVRITAAAR